jgi:hypothetical protein
LGYTSSGTSGGGADNRDAKQLAAGVVYDLSKRTAVYSDISRISNTGGAGGASYRNGGSVANTVGARSTAFDIGVRHSFYWVFDALRPDAGGQKLRTAALGRLFSFWCFNEQLKGE